MTLLDDLEAKLSEAQSQVAAVSSELKEFANIKDSLRSTDTQIKDAAKQLEHLSGTLSKGASSLETASKSLADTHEIIRKTDPAQVLKELTNITQAQGNLEKLIGSSVSASEEKVTSSIENMGTAIQSKIDTGITDLRNSISQGLDGAKSELKESITNATKAQKVILAVGVLNTLLLIGLAAKLVL